MVRIFGSFEPIFAQKSEQHNRVVILLFLYISVQFSILGPSLTATFSETKNFSIFAKNRQKRGYLFSQMEQRCIEAIK